MKIVPRILLLILMFLSCKKETDIPLNDTETRMDSTLLDESLYQTYGMNSFLKKEDV